MVSSVQDGIYALGKAHISQIFPQHSFWNSSNVRLIDDDPLSFFHGRSSNASSFHTSLLQINGVMSLALCLQVVSQAPQNFRSSEMQVTCEGCFPTSLSAQSFPFPPACPGQYAHWSFRRWMATIDTFQFRLSIQLFTFCSKLIESVRIVACVVWLSPLEAIHQRTWVTASISIHIVKLEKYNGHADQCVL